MNESYADDLTNKIIGAAIEVHKNLGPGLLESAYEACLEHELYLRNLKVETQLIFPITYKGLKLKTEYRIDMLVEKHIVIEIKSVKEFNFIHEHQLLTYLRLLGGGIGLLINFNVPLLRYGIKRIIL